VISPRPGARSIVPYRMTQPFAGSYTLPPPPLP
jgi:hypothetical protein